MVVLTGAGTLVFADEKSSLVDAMSSGAAATTRRRELLLIAYMWSAVRDMPRPLLRVLGAFFASWCSFSPFLILDSLWFGRNVYEGAIGGAGPTTNDAAFKLGVHMSLYNSASFSAVTLAFSLVLPAAISSLGVKVVHFPWALMLAFLLTP